MNKYSRLLWRCRRGMREMDILLLNYLENHYHNTSTEEQHNFATLLNENDLDILSWIMQKTRPDDERYAAIIATIRNQPITQKIING